VAYQRTVDMYLYMRNYGVEANFPVTGTRYDSFDLKHAHRQSDLLLCDAKPLISI
jgi:hypothetical protein